MRCISYYRMLLGFSDEYIGMQKFPWALLVIAILLLGILFIPIYERTHKQATIGGIRVSATLEELFKLAVTPLELSAILTPGKEVVWSTTKEVKMSDDYSVVHDYILLLSTPKKVDNDHVGGYEADTRERLKRIFHRDIFKGVVTPAGDKIGHIVIELRHTMYIVGGVFITLAVILGVHNVLNKA